MLKKLIKRVVDISFTHHLAHIGSCLTALPIIYGIYSGKKEEDIFILSNGHAGLALYVVLEDKYSVDAEMLYLKHGVHPCRDEANKIYCSTGSLGMGITIAIGTALADRNRQVHCLISDGECAEGAIWESLNCKEKYSLDNLTVHVNMNGYSAMAEVNCDRLTTKLKSLCPEIKIYNTNTGISFLHGLDAHYRVFNQADYDLANIEINSIA